MGYYRYSPNAQHTLFPNTSVQNYEERRMAE
jgi:hypothetical protein